MLHSNSPFCTTSMPFFNKLKRSFHRVRSALTPKKAENNIFISGPSSSMASPPASPTPPLTPQLSDISLTSTTPSFSKKEENDKKEYFVYLGGSSSSTVNNWRRKVVVPILKRQHISFYSGEPLWTALVEDSVRKEAEVRKRCRCLLFVFCKNLSASALVEATYYIGRQQADPFETKASQAFRLFLCVDDNLDPCSFLRDGFSEAEQQHAWLVLAEIAPRHGHDLTVDLPTTDLLCRSSVPEMMLIGHCIGRHNRLCFDSPQVVITTSLQCFVHLADRAQVPIFRRLSEMMINVSAYCDEVMQWKSFKPF